MMDGQVHQFSVDDPSAGRLDKFLVACLPDYSRSRLQDLIRDGNVLVNGKTAHKSGQMLECGMQSGSLSARNPAQPYDG